MHPDFCHPCANASLTILGNDWLGLDAYPMPPAAGGREAGAAWRLLLGQLSFGRVTSTPRASVFLLKMKNIASFIRKLNPDSIQATFPRPKFDGVSLPAADFLHALVDISVTDGKAWDYAVGLVALCTQCHNTRPLDGGVTPLEVAEVHRSIDALPKDEPALLAHIYSWMSCYHADVPPVLEPHLECALGKIEPPSPTSLLWLAAIYMTFDPLLDALRDFWEQRRAERAASAESEVSTPVAPEPVAVACPLSDLTARDPDMDRVPTCPRISNDLLASDDLHADTDASATPLYWSTCTSPSSSPSPSPSSSCSVGLVEGGDRADVEPTDPTDSANLPSAASSSPSPSSTAFCSSFSSSSSTLPAMGNRLFSASVDEVATEINAAVELQTLRDLSTAVFDSTPEIGPVQVSVMPDAEMTDDAPVADAMCVCAPELPDPLRAAVPQDLHCASTSASVPADDDITSRLWELARNPFGQRSRKDKKLVAANLEQYLAMQCAVASERSEGAKSNQRKMHLRPRPNSRTPREFWQRLEQAKECQDERRSQVARLARETDRFLRRVASMESPSQPDPILSQ